MSDLIKFSLPGMAHDAVQSLLEGKRAARTLENIVEALVPVFSNEEVIRQLEEIREAAAKAGYTLQRLYNKNAKEVFSESPSDQGQPGRDRSTRTRRGDVGERQETGGAETGRDKADGE